MPYEYDPDPHAGKEIPAMQDELWPEVKEALDASNPANISDYGYHGDLERGDVWASTIGKSRDSDVLTRSNFDVILADMEERFPEDVTTEAANHWAVGWVEHIMVRMLDEAGNITDAAHAIFEWKYALDDYPVADEEHYSELEHGELMTSFDDAFSTDLTFSEEESDRIKADVLDLFYETDAYDEARGNENYVDSADLKPLLAESDVLRQVMEQKYGPLVSEIERYFSSEMESMGPDDAAEMVLNALAQEDKDIGYLDGDEAEWHILEEMVRRGPVPDPRQQTLPLEARTRHAVVTSYILADRGAYSEMTRIEDHPHAPKDSVGRDEGLWRGRDDVREPEADALLAELGFDCPWTWIKSMSGTRYREDAVVVGTESGCVPNESWQPQRFASARVAWDAPDRGRGGAASEDFAPDTSRIEEMFTTWGWEDVNEYAGQNLGEDLSGEGPYDLLKGIDADPDDVKDYLQGRWDDLTGRGEVADTFNAALAELEGSLANWAEDFVARVVETAQAKISDETARDKFYGWLAEPRNVWLVMMQEAGHGVGLEDETTDAEYLDDLGIEPDDLMPSTRDGAMSYSNLHDEYTMLSEQAGAKAARIGIEEFLAEEGGEDF